MNITCSHCGCVQPISLVEVKTDYKLLVEAKKRAKELEEDSKIKVELLDELKLRIKKKKYSFWEHLTNKVLVDVLTQKDKYNDACKLHNEYIDNEFKEVDELKKYSKYWICKLCKSKNGVGTHI